jgi:hypothetical protein
MEAQKMGPPSALLAFMPASCPIVPFDGPTTARRWYREHRPLYRLAGAHLTGVTSSDDTDRHGDAPLSTLGEQRTDSPREALS